MFIKTIIFKDIHETWYFHFSILNHNIQKCTFLNNIEYTFLHKLIEEKWPSDNQIINIIRNYDRKINVICSTFHTCKLLTGAPHINFKIAQSTFFCQ